MNDDFYKYAYDIVVNLGRTFYGTRKEADFLEKVLKLKAGSTVLDIGCGTGKLSIELARRGYKVTSIDISEWSIAQGKTTAKNKNINNIQWILDDFIQHQFNSNFDAVFHISAFLGSAFDNLSLGEFTFSLQKIFNILQKNGRFVFDHVIYEFIIKRVPIYSWNIIDNIVILSNLFVTYDKILTGYQLYFRKDLHSFSHRALKDSVSLKMALLKVADFLRIRKFLMNEKMRLPRKLRNLLAMTTSS